MFEYVSRMLIDVCGFLSKQIISLKFFLENSMASDFTDSGLWAGSVIELPCPYFCLFVSMSVPWVQFFWRGLLHIPPNLGWGVCVCVRGGLGGCHVSRVTCHVSRVTCHVSRVTCHMSLKMLPKLKTGVCFRSKILRAS